MNTNTDLRRKLAAALILVIGIVVLALAGTSIQIIVGLVGGYSIAYLASNAFQGKQREAGLGAIGALAGLTLLGGLVNYLLTGNDLVLQFGVGLLVGYFPGAIFGQPPAAK